MLVYANTRWPQCVNAHLWPYAIRIANESINKSNSPIMSRVDKATPMEIWTKTTSLHKCQVAIHPFGCPTFVLNGALQRNKPYNKWKSRTSVGIYLGHSTIRGRWVSLVLDQATPGLVSPQHHVDFADPTFQVTQQDQYDYLWQSKAGFLDKREGKTKAQSILFFRRSKFEVRSSALWRLSILVLPKTKFEVQTTNEIPAACI